jgi:hypothetical protein
MSISARCGAAGLPAGRVTHPAGWRRYLSDPPFLLIHGGSDIPAAHCFYRRKDRCSPRKTSVEIPPGEDLLLSGEDAMMCSIHRYTIPEVLPDLTRRFAELPYEHTFLPTLLE